MCTTDAEISKKTRYEKAVHYLTTSDYLTSLACTMVTVGLLIAIISVLIFGKINLAIQWKRHRNNTRF